MYCPHCEQKIRVREEYYGKRVKCPSCSERFIVDPETEEPMVVGDVDDAVDEERPVRKRRPPPPPDEDEEAERPKRRKAARQEEEEEEEEMESRVTRRKPSSASEPPEEEEEPSEEEEERPRKAKGNKAAWRKVRTGLTIILVTVAVGFALGSLLAAASAAIGAAAGANPQQPPQPSPLVATVGPILGTLLQISNMIGLAFCAGAPAKRGAKTLAIVALSLAALGLLLDLAQVALNLTETPPPAGDKTSPQPAMGGLLGGFGIMIGMFHFIVFLLFLRAVALILGRDGLGTSLVINMVLVGLCVLLVGVVVVGAFVGLAGGSGKAGGFIAVAGGACLLLIFMFAAGIMYLVNLTKVRTAVSEKAGR